MGVVAEKTRTREQTLGILLSSLYRTEGLNTRATQLSAPASSGSGRGPRACLSEFPIVNFTAHPVNNDRVHSCSVEAAGGRDNRQGSEND